MHTVADFVQDPEADTGTEKVQKDTLLILYGGGSTKFAQLDALSAKNMDHVGGTGTHFSDAADCVGYEVHLAQFRSSVCSHHLLDSKQDFWPGGGAS